MNIKKVTVIGANGTMGSNVAGIFAAFGEAHVYMVSRSKEKSKEAIERAAKSVRADSIKKHMEAMDYSQLEECIGNSDLIFESVAEKMDLKIQMLEKIAQFAKENALICTGTSGLSINEMSKSLPENMRKNYMGMHFFNPPYNLTLCEMIFSDYVTEEKKEEIASYLTETLLRSCVQVKDKPAFMGNRIGFYLMNLAMQYAEKYKADGGIDYIDAIMGGFTGRNMPPIRTADFVGLDVHKAIVDNVYSHTDGLGREAFVLPDYVKQLIEAGKVGRKVGEGLYKTVVQEGNKEYFVYDIEKDEYRHLRKYKFDFSEEMITLLSEGAYEEAISKLVDNTSKEAEICKKFLIKYILYSLYINKEAGYTIHDADDAMATGFSWIPPLALIEAFGGKEQFQYLADDILSANELRKYNMQELLLECPQSRYDYRRYLKAKR